MSQFINKKREDEKKLRRQIFLADIQEIDVTAMLMDSSETVVSKQSAPQNSKMISNFTFQSRWIHLNESVWNKSRRFSLDVGSHKQLSIGRLLLCKVEMTPGKKVITACLTSNIT